MPPAPVTAAAQLKMCYLLPTHRKDLGFTYNAMISVGTVKKKMEQKYPNATVSHLVRSNQLMEPNLTATLVELASVDRCSMILLCSRALVDMKLPSGLNPIAMLFPDVIFWAFSAPIAASSSPNKPPNVIGFIGNPSPSWYVAGVAAGVECRSCVGFMVPTRFQSFVANSFHQGMLFGEQFRDDGANISRLCPVIGVELGSFSSTPSERAFARTMMARGCSVIAVFADSYDASKIVQLSQTSGNSSVFTVAGNVNGALVVGDTVLTSVFFTLLEAFEYLTEELILGRMPQHGTPIISVLGSISPLARHSTFVATEEARKRISANISVLFCAPFRDKNGNPLRPNGSCFENISDFNAMNVMTQPIMNLGLFSSPLQCLPGTFCSYNVTGDLSLTCPPCPANTYSATSGQFSCTPCPAGLVSRGNSSHCSTPPESDSKKTSLTFILLLALLLPMAIIVAVGFLAVRFRSHKVEAPAPRESPLAFAIIDVDSERSSPNWREQMRNAELVFDLLRDSVFKAADANKAFVVYASPTTFLVAARTVQQVHQVAEGVEHLLIFSYPQSVTALAIRAVIHFGEALYIPPNKRSPRAQYMGPALDVLLDVNREPQCRVGQIVLTGPAFDELKKSDPTVESRVTNGYKLSSGTLKELSCFRILFSAALNGQSITHNSALTAGDSTNKLPTRSSEAAAALTDNSTTTLSMVVTSQRQQLTGMCTYMLQIFLGVLKLEGQARMAHILQQRFRISSPVVRSDPKDITKYLCANIAPGLLSTMDEVHLREVIQMINEAGGPVSGGLKQRRSAAKLKQ